MEEKRYACIDLKSFYASVECIERGLDPMSTNLVVADVSRTEKTICLAVTPPLKAYGIPGRARLFEVIQRLKYINAERQRSAPGRCLTAKSCDANELRANPSLEVDYIAASPQMARYIEVSTQIYRIYLKYVSPEDIHVYSIDEVFIDLTRYLKTAGHTARDFVSLMIADVMETTGITAAAGIGTNLYLAKIAMDIGAKHAQPDKNGVRIAELDETSYRRSLWSHRPLTDFWRVGGGISKKLEEYGMCTMGDVARCSVSVGYHSEELLYKLFGVNAELLIDHAWGYEPCTIADIKAFKPEAHSTGSGQVLKHPYTCEKARLVVREMVDLLVLDLVDKRLVTDSIILTIGYDVENLQGESEYTGEVTTDRYGRKTPKHSQGNAKLESRTSSTKKITEAVIALYDRIADPRLLVRRINLVACNVIDETEAAEIQSQTPMQLDMFTDYEALERRESAEKAERERERRMQEAVIGLKKRYGKNIILKGMNLEEDATAKDRNSQIGGHKA